MKVFQNWIILYDKTMSYNLSHIVQEYAWNT